MVTDLDRLDVEKAALFSELNALQAYDGACDRIYFGHEFCQRLLPSADALCGAAAHASGEGKTFSFVTPFVSNAGLARVKALLGVLDDKVLQAEGFEVVANDWGVLHWLHREHPDISIVVGRLLTKQKRGPRIMRIADRLPRAAVEHFRRSNIDVPRMQQFLKTQSVVRVELDNLLQGITRSDGLPASLYYPYGYISTTRLCLLANGDREDKNLRSLGPCHRECRTYDVTLKHEDMPVPIILEGNTQYFRNDVLPGDFAALNIDRLVFMPELNG